jgi:hypothetical protein
VCVCVCVVCVCVRARACVVCLSVCLSGWLSVCLSACLSVYVCVFVCVCVAGDKGLLSTVLEQKKEPTPAKGPQVCQREYISFA